MKFAIITPNGQYNYGNRLQNYAITQIVSRAGGHAETLYLEENYLKLLVKAGLLQTNLWPLVLGTYQKERRVDLECSRYRKFKAFTKQYIPTRYFGGRNLKRLADEYDYFLIGSDQIWNPNQLARSCDFADFARPEQKIAVAPSFGVDQLTVEQENRLAPMLKTFRNLSVRENSGAAIIKKLTGLNAKVLIDPTMMLTHEDWSAVSQKPDWMETAVPYILSYFLGGKDEKSQKQIDRYGEEIGAIEYPLLNKEKSELYSTGPAEFLWLLEHAALVCTDSFHAVVFSILFNRPFVTFKRGGDGAGMEDRISTLLCTMKLQDQQLRGTNQFRTVLTHDYSECYKVLDQERKKFKDYLQSAVPSMDWR